MSPVGSSTGMDLLVIVELEVNHAIPAEAGHGNAGLAVKRFGQSEPEALIGRGIGVSFVALTTYLVYLLSSIV